MINERPTANILHRLQSGTVDQNVSRKFCIFYGKNTAAQRLRQHIGGPLWHIFGAFGIKSKIRHQLILNI